MRDDSFSAPGPVLEIYILKYNIYINDLYNFGRIIIGVHYLVKKNCQNFFFLLLMLLLWESGCFGVRPFMFGLVITRTVCACVVFLRRRDFRNNSEGQNETVRGGSCDGQPFKKN